MENRRQSASREERESKKKKKNLAWCYLHTWICGAGPILEEYRVRHLIPTVRPIKKKRAEEVDGKNSPGGRNGNADASITLTEEKPLVYRQMPKGQRKSSHNS